jgi:hypothetical protein
MERRRSMTKVVMGFVVVFLLLSVFSPAAEGVEFTLNGVRFNNVLLGFLPVPAGVDVEFAFPVTRSGLMFSLRIAGGYEDRLILRDDTDGSPVPKPVSFDNDAWFHWPNGQVDAGFAYRVGGALEFFALGRGRYEKNSPGLPGGYFPDANGLFAFSALGGISVDMVEKLPSRMKRGIGGEVAIEYAPSFASLAGGSDFYRASARLEAYLPLFATNEDPKKAVSSYLGLFLAGDHAGGNSIPLYVLTSFGGRHLRDGLGDSIRGYQPWGYEATTKVEASLDLRLVGPALFGLPGLRPVGYVFGDAGYFAGLYDCPSVADKDGFLFSAGAGVALGVFDFAYIGARAGYTFPTLDPLYTAYYPGGERFFWDITFLLHF